MAEEMAVAMTGAKVGPQAVATTTRAAAYVFEIASDEFVA